MNIIQILWKLGWDVLSFNEDGEYKIQVGKIRKNLTYKKEKEGIIGPVEDIDKIYIVKVIDVGFNVFGDLYLSFEDIETGDLIDCYEHNNMAADELF